MRKKFLFFMLCSLMGFSLKAQQSQIGKTARAGIVDLSQTGVPDYEPNLQNIGSVKAPGGQVVATKRWVDSVCSMRPAASEGAVFMKTAGPAPQLGLEFQGNTAGGTPNDNDVCIGNNGYIISVLNSNLRIFDTTGKTLVSKSLAFLAQSVGDLNRTFDPRTIYDPIHDRYIVVFLNGSESNNNNPVVCFSQTNDPTKEWNCFLLPGNPFNDTSWSDYPIISISDKDIFLTLNLLTDGKGWKDGFKQSIIWQLSLEDGYAGDSLTHILWSDIKYNNQPVWSICPAQGGMKPGSPGAFFLSVRPGDVQNDSLFIHYITNSVSSGTATISTELVRCSQPYGLPPSAKQPDGQYLETNDARVLTAMIEADVLHFAGNSRDFSRNSSAIYYGRWPLGSSTANVTYLSSDTLSFGYPDLAYAGTGAKGDHTAIMTVSHVSENTLPGTSVVYINYSGEFSGITRVKSGLRSIDVLTDTFERWGDYSGIQRRYSNGREFWLAGNYGDRINRTVIAKVSNNDPALSVPETNSTPSELYPNPTSSVFQLEFDLAERERLSFEVLDMQGKVVVVLMEDMVKAGKNRFAFNARDLPSGQYILQVRGLQTSFSQRLVIIR